MAHGENAAKPYGKEYWSRRPGNKHGGLLGRFQKSATHKRERAETRKLERNALIDEQPD